MFFFFCFEKHFENIFLLIITVSIANYIAIRCFIQRSFVLAWAGVDQRFVHFNAIDVARRSATHASAQRHRATVRRNAIQRVRRRVERRRPRHEKLLMVGGTAHRHRLLGSASLSSSHAAAVVETSVIDSARDCVAVVCRRGGRARGRVVVWQHCTLAAFTSLYRIAESIVG